MHPRWAPIEDVVQLERLLTTPDSRPLLLFKHSRSCGTSAEALDELEAHLSEEATADTRYAIVTVQTHREVSAAVALTLGVRHETPQALLIQDGRVVWSASHYRVTADAVEAAIKRLQPSEGVAVA
jgi:bacillithiol system protein YtxJ